MEEGQTAHRSPARRQLRQQASVEDVDYRAARGLDRALSRNSRMANGSTLVTISRSLAPAASQKLACLRHRPESLPRQSLRPLSSLAEAGRGPDARPG